MPPQTIIGQVQKVDLVIYQDSSLSLDVEWWGNESYTNPINMSHRVALLSVGGKTFDLGELGLAPFTGNICTIRLPASFSSTLPAVDGVWSFMGVDAISGEEKMLVRGVVKVRGKS